MDQSEATTVDQLAQWQAALRARPGITQDRIEASEARLCDIVEEFVESGLSPDEAFLLAVKRVAAEDPWSREVAATDANRLWDQLVLGVRSSVLGARPDGGPDGPGEQGRQRGPGGLWAMLAFAVLAGLVLRVPFAIRQAVGPTTFPDHHESVTYGIGAAAVVAAYVCWLRRPAPRVVYAVLGAVFAVALLAVNLYPFEYPYDTRFLTTLHLGIALWVVVGAAYLGRDWRVGQRWMDYIRFSGELAILYVLIALGGGVLVGLTAAIFGLVGVSIDTVLSWVVPMGAAGAVVVAAWLVEARKGAVQNIAPVLSAVFTPLFTLVLLSFLVTIAVTGELVDLDRQLLIVFDVFLALVLALVVFSASARDPLTGPKPSDVMQVVLIGSSLVVDVVVLAAMAGRIGEYGASPNKLAALGENIVLLVNLAGSGWLYLRFLRGRGRFAALEQWQGRYVAVFGAWALVVALGLPLVFGFR